MEKIKVDESILIFIFFFQVDKATSDLRNTNVRLKHTVNQVINNKLIIFFCIVFFMIKNLTFLFF